MVLEEFPRAATCEHCHGEVFAEWSASPHAKAYTNAHFREATDEYRFNACLGCHAPEPMVTNDRPSVRSIYRDEGVTCVSCHLEEGKLSGPIDPTSMVPPHPVDANQSKYRDSRFCGRCHEGTLLEWNAVEMENKPSCQQCHMPPKKRKLTQASGTIGKLFVAFEEEILQKRHTFATVPEQLESPPYEVKMINDTETLRLTILNHLPHSLPPGDFGIRIIILKAFKVDLSGNALPIGEYELIKELGSAIPPRSSVGWELPIPADARSILIRMVRQGPGGLETKILMETEVFVR